MSLIPFNPGVNYGAKALYNSTTVDLSAETSSPRSISWSPDGKELFVARRGVTGVGSRRVEVYETPIAYRVQSLTHKFAVYVDTSNLNSPDDYHYGVVRTESEFFVLGDGDEIVKFTLAANSETFVHSISIPAGVDGDLRFNGNGTIVFYQDNTTIYQRPLSTAYDLTTAGSASSTDFSGDISGLCRGFCFNSNGSKLHIVSSGAGNRDIYTFNLSTEYNLSTAGTPTTQDYSYLAPGDAWSIEADNVGDLLILFDTATVAKVV